MASAFARQSAGHVCHPSQLVSAAYRRCCSQRLSPALTHTFFSAPTGRLWRKPSSHRQARLRNVRSYSWGQDVEWTPVKIKKTYKAAEGMQTIILDIGHLGSAYQKGGQFLQLKVKDGKPGFYAIASGPKSGSNGIVELLVKDSGQTAEQLCQALEGSEVLASPVMGNGFPVERCPPQDFPILLIFATGSGISPIRSLIESQTLQLDQRKDVRLYYGTLDEAHTAFTDRIAEWEALGITVTSVYSNGGGEYVQTVFEKEGTPDGSQTCAVLVGQKEMCQAVTDILQRQGVSKEHMLLNF